MNSLMWLLISSSWASPFIKSRKWITVGDGTNLSQERYSSSKCLLYDSSIISRAHTCPELASIRENSKSYTRGKSDATASFVKFHLPPILIHIHLCVGISIIEAWGVSIQWQMGIALASVALMALWPPK